MTSDGHDLGLIFSLNLLLGEQLSDLLCGLISIEERHVAVHQNKFVSKRVALLDACLDLFDSMLSVVSKVGSFLSIGEAKDQKEPRDDVTVESFIVYHKDLGSVWAL